MDEKQVTRVWNYTMPSTTTLPWTFSFFLVFRQKTSQVVEIGYHEISIGSGTFTVKDCGITWFSLLKADGYCYRLAYNHAMDWNELDDRIQEKERGTK